MRALILLGSATTVFLLASCARVDDSAVPADVGQGDSALAADTSNDAGTPSDGCPADPKALIDVGCSTPGQKCLYTEFCSKPSSSAQEFECQGVLEEGSPYSERWKPKAIDCQTLVDSRGCPLGPAVGMPCSSPGLDCYYWPALCKGAEPKDAATVAHVECAAVEAGTVWLNRPRVPCSEVDGGSK